MSSPLFSFMSGPFCSLGLTFSGLQEWRGLSARKKISENLEIHPQEKIISDFFSTGSFTWSCVMQMLNADVKIYQSCQSCQGLLQATVTAPPCIDFSWTDFFRLKEHRTCTNAKRPSFPSEGPNFWRDGMSLQYPIVQYLPMSTYRKSAQIYILAFNT